jgi:alkylhydroperoxidase/carboxymuconolactone decarboxylase family protein YurZ
MPMSSMTVCAAVGELAKTVSGDGAPSKKRGELTALAVAASPNCVDGIDHRVAEVLDQGATEGEIAETLDVGLLRGATRAATPVRHTCSVREELRTAKGE